ncbi:uncharacterized protein K452DRAFT_286975 [Aplosporella prunicola CBS 121167]|uniref:Secreted protein n=1 Tax=Aplosporella prunicola CBS 121167 TaxID=1176127 RepID=A0A6A6BG44_9PEZI|nr:uncharacterized protein K452DRAFT_286975 [Aplosporella prunicola CBS 121167]KAF2142548.1 hypothetical protein K452DRAFT_286975 [Aplosporella prunicola CBS 121167]
MAAILPLHVVTLRCVLAVRLIGTYACQPKGVPVPRCVVGLLGEKKQKNSWFPLACVSRSLPSRSYPSASRVWVDDNNR